MKKLLLRILVILPFFEFLQATNLNLATFQLQQQAYNVRDPRGTRRNQDLQYLANLYRLFGVQPSTGGLGTNQLFPTNSLINTAFNPSLQGTQYPYNTNNLYGNQYPVNSQYYPTNSLVNTAINPSLQGTNQFSSQFPNNNVYGTNQFPVNSQFNSNGLQTGQVNPSYNQFTNTQYNPNVGRK